MKEIQEEAEDEDSSDLQIIDSPMTSPLKDNVPHIDIMSSN